MERELRGRQRRRREESRRLEQEQAEQARKEILLQAETERMGCGEEDNMEPESNGIWDGSDAAIVCEKGVYMPRTGLVWIWRQQIKDALQKAIFAHQYDIDPELVEIRMYGVQSCTLLFPTGGKIMMSLAEGMDIYEQLSGLVGYMVETKDKEG